MPVFLLRVLDVARLSFEMQYVRIQNPIYAN
jgi:hypothetical protein